MPLIGPLASGVLEGQLEEADDVVDVDPAHPLLTLGDRASAAADGRAPGPA